MKKVLAVLVVLVAAMGFAQTASDVVTRIGTPVVGSQGGAPQILDRLFQQGLICRSTVELVSPLLPNGSMSVDVFNVFVADVFNGRGCVASAQAAKEYLGVRGVNVTAVNNAAVSSVLNSTSLSQSAGIANNPATPVRR